MARTVSAHISTCRAQKDLERPFPSLQKSSAMPALYTVCEEWPCEQLDKDTAWIIYATHEEVSRVGSETFMFVCARAHHTRRHAGVKLRRCEIQRLKLPTREG